jgi:uncharacterized repeat protein (TIGR03809 family)
MLPRRSSRNSVFAIGLGAAMPQARCAHLDEVSRKWRALAERRLAHFVELCETGRWKRYFSEEEFLRRMREAMAMSERWSEIAPTPPEQDRRAAA